VVASDPDAGDVLTYAMQRGNFDGAVVIDPQQGAIAVIDRAELPPALTQLQLIITATDRGGLSGEGVVDITMAGTPVEGIVPERGFSPNGDSFNDFWLIRGIEAFPDNQVRVFNRWGNLVYEASGYDNSLHRWSGEVNGARAVSENTYFFIITAAAQSMTGYVIVKP
jgi:gliding motility-associated-like protein